MPDMLVKLYELPDEIPELEKMKELNIRILRAMPPDKFRVLEFIEKTFGKGWASECDVSFSNKPVSCFIAVKDKQVIGFACYNATAPDFFGPTGVDEKYRKLGIGKVLLLKCLQAMKALGYGYAIIGGAAVPEFYSKACGATIIDGSYPGIYGDMVEGE
jgi:hypothetical protein